MAEEKNACIDLPEDISVCDHSVDEVFVSADELENIKITVDNDKRFVFYNDLQLIYEGIIHSTENSSVFLYGVTFDDGKSLKLAIKTFPHSPDLFEKEKTIIKVLNSIDCDNIVPCKVIDDCVVMPALHSLEELVVSSTSGVSSETTFRVDENNPFGGNANLNVSGEKLANPFGGDANLDVSGEKVANRRDEHDDLIKEDAIVLDGKLNGDTAENIVHAIGSVMYCVMKSANLFYTDIKVENVLFRCCGGRRIEIYLADVGGFSPENEIAPFTLRRNWLGMFYKYFSHRNVMRYGLARVWQDLLKNKQDIPSEILHVLEDPRYHADEMLFLHDLRDDGIKRQIKRAERSLKFLKNEIRKKQNSKDKKNYIDIMKKQKKMYEKKIADLKKLLIKFRF